MSMRLQRTGPKPRPGIVHLGPGAFFRAFNAVYTDDAMAASEGDWGIIAASLRSASARDALVPQGCAYTSVTLAADPAPRVIGSVCDVLVAPEDPLRLCNAMARAETRIVSLTITEKGYCRAAAEDRLDMHHADIAHDLQNPGAPRSAVALIVAALALRWRAGLDPFTILSCDNLPSNGRLLRQLVLDFAGASVPDMVPWIEDAVAFPSTMVDRITPATTEQDRARLADMTGYEDRACVFHEPFRQWVIEDSFCAGRPVWEAGGALFVKDVHAHEVMKLRCLNGTHSALAYLGYLAGHETIADVTADADFVRYCQRLWTEEILPTVPCPEGEDLEAYCARLLARYQNRAIQHRTWQIAMDGSQKVPQRLLGNDFRSACSGEAARRPVSRRRRLDALRQSRGRKRQSH